MSLLKWNLCTTFAAIGVAVAYAILFFIFGLHWQYLPGAIAGLGAGYLVSTLLGAGALRVQLGRHALSSMLVGAGIAWLTLLCITLAVAIATFFLEALLAVINAPAGQPFSNVLGEHLPGQASDFIGKPLVVGLVFGFMPAGILGVVYGIVLRNRFDPSQAQAPAARRWTLIASGGTLLTLLLAASMLVQSPITIPASEHYAGVPIAIRGCGEVPVASGVLAYCRGNPCENGECRWDEEQDAFALYVQPPEGTAWTWTGGGIGAGRQPNLLSHNTYWAQLEPDGSLIDSSPRWHASYDMVFSDKTLGIEGRPFRFEPGMLVRLQFTDDWSVTVSDAADSQQPGVASTADLQEALDEACANVIQCGTSFRIRSDSKL